MSFRQSYIVQDCSLLKFIQHAVEVSIAPSWLVICSTREVFEEALAAAIAAEPNDIAVPQHNIASHPTMRTLAATTALYLVFVPELVHLKAFLAARALDERLPDADGRGTLTILNAIGAHRSASTLSAQALNRTLALCIDTAAALNSNLVLYETPYVDQSEPPLESESNVWNHDIGILDARTKTFGPGHRGWLGRTVKIRQVASRWMTFKQLETSD